MGYSWQKARLYVATVLAASELAGLCKNSPKVIMMTMTMTTKIIIMMMMTMMTTCAGTLQR